jgi:preprotein translocase subunit SecG
MKLVRKKPLNQYKSMKIISIAQAIVSVALIISILLQNRGSGLSSAFGGDFGGYYTKRGIEKFLFYFSIVASVFFLGLAIANIVIANR